MLLTLASNLTFTNGIANMTYVNFIPFDTAAKTPAAFAILDGRFKNAIPPDAEQVHELSLRCRQPTVLDRALYLAMAEKEIGETKDSGFLLRTITGKTISDESPIDAIRLCQADL